MDDPVYHGYFYLFVWHEYLDFGFLSGLLNMVQCI
jgi:hypothetical protein